MEVNYFLDLWICSVYTQQAYSLGEDWELYLGMVFGEFQ